MARKGLFNGAKLDNWVGLLLFLLCFFLHSTEPTWLGMDKTGSTHGDSRAEHESASFIFFFFMLLFVGYFFYTTHIHPHTHKDRSTGFEEVGVGECLVFLVGKMRS